MVPHTKPKKFDCWKFHGKIEILIKKQKAAPRYLRNSLKTWG